MLHKQINVHNYIYFEPVLIFDQRLLEIKTLVETGYVTKRHTHNISIYLYTVYVILADRYGIP